MKFRIPIPKRLPRMQRTVRVKLTVGFLMVAAIVLVAAVAGILSVQRVGAASNQIVEVHIPRTQTSNAAQTNAMRLSDAYYQSLVQITPSATREAAEEGEQFDVEARRLLTALLEGDAELGLPRMTDPQGVEILNRAIDAYDVFYNAGQEMVRAHVRNLQGGVDIGRGLSVIQYMGTFDEARDDLFAVLAELEDTIAGDVAAAQRTAVETQAVAYSIMAIILVASLVAAVGIGFVISRQITVPLRRAVAFAETIASGDLSTRMHARSGDELGMLANALNQMTENLSVVIGTIKTSSDDLATAAEQISATTRTISEGAETQSSATEETTVSMEEMAASIDQVASNAEQLGSSADETSATIGEMAASVEQIAHSVESLSTVVGSTAKGIQTVIQSTEEVAERASNVSQMTDEAGKAANDGVEKVESMAEVMVAIAESVEGTVDVVKSLGKRSKEIGEITGVIDDIAEQTNLLALNAAIEAARAGEHGRGFAVVAEAVRELAERSTESTKEISQLISTIQEDTEQAVVATLDTAKRALESRAVSDEATETLHNISSTFDEVIDAMKQIRSATAEQARSGRTVLAEVDEMGMLHKQVDTAIQEQAHGSQQIVTAVEYMTNLVSQVVGATGEQKRGGEHMVMAMENIAQATRTNLSGITELARAANNLADQSSNLREVVEKFKLA